MISRRQFFKLTAATGGQRAAASGPRDPATHASAAGLGRVAAGAGSGRDPLAAQAGRVGWMARLLAGATVP